MMQGLGCIGILDRSVRRKCLRGMGPLELKGAFFLATFCSYCLECVICGMLHSDEISVTCVGEELPKCARLER